MYELEKQDPKRMYLVLCLAWVSFVVAMGCVVDAREARAEDWKVQDRERRQAEILRRFQEIVEKKPDRGFAFQRMVQLGQRWPGLDRLVKSYREKSKKAPKQIAYRLILGHLLHRTRQRVEALAAYDGVLAIAPQHPLALRYRAEALQELQRYDEAFVAFQKLLGVTKEREQRRQALKALGTLALLRKQPKEALVYWKQFLQMSPRNTQAREELARALGSAKLYEEALEQWREVLKQRGRGMARADVLRQIGLLEEERGRWQEAVKVYREAMEMTQGGHWLRKELGERILQIHREQGKLMDLVGYMQAKKRKDAAELAMLARLFDELGRDKEAREAYGKALKAAPRDSRLRLRLVTLLEVMGDQEGAIREYRALIRVESSEPRYQMAFAEMLSRAGKPKEALAQMALIAKRFSRNTEVLSRLTRLYRRRRMHKEANALLQQLIRVEPRESSHRSALGSFYYNQGEIKKADQIWRGILQSGLPKAKAYLALGQIYRTHDRERDALTAFQQAAKLAPKDMTVLRALGDAYQRMLSDETELKPKELKEAIAIWKKIYDASKPLGEKKTALRRLFALYQAEGTLYKWPSEYRDRLIRQPSDIEAMRSLGEYYLWQAQRQRRYNSQARLYFEKILERQAGDIDALLTLERLEAGSGNWFKAKGYLLKAAAVDKKGRRVYYRRLYEYSLKMRQNDEAIRYGRRLVEIHPDDAASHAELARLLQKVGRSQEALAAYQEALRLQPQNHGYHQALGHLLRKMGQGEKAVERYLFVVKNSRESALIYDATIQLLELMQRKEDLNALEITLKTLSEQHPRELSYFRALAEMYRRQERTKEYQIAYLKAATSVDDKTQVYKKLAETAEKQGDIPKAIIYYRKMLEESNQPSSAQQLHLAKLYLGVQDKANARKLMLAMLNEHPNNINMLREVAKLFEGAQLHDEAIHSYELFLELQPAEDGVRLALAELYLQKQQREAAIGLYEAVFWGETTKPLRKPKAKGKKASSASTNPAYLRGRSRYARYMYRRRWGSYRYGLDPVRKKALERLLDLYEQTQRLDEWERRAQMGLRISSHDRLSTMRLMAATYKSRSWSERLQRLLEASQKSYPYDTNIAQELAKFYIEQGLHQKAFALFRRLEVQGSTDRNLPLLLAKIEMLIKIKNEERLNYTLQTYLNSPYVYQYYTLLQIVGLLEQAGFHKQAIVLLRHRIPKVSPTQRPQLQQRLIQIYMLISKEKEARKELLAQWYEKKTSSSYNLIQVQKNREDLIKLLWPLLEDSEQQAFIKKTEKDVMDAMLSTNPELLRRAVLDAYLVKGITEGEEAAQAYLPALWGIAEKRTDSSFSAVVMKKLLEKNSEEDLLRVLKEEAKGLNSPTAELGFVMMMLLYSQEANRLPTSLGRFLEKMLRKNLDRIRPSSWQSAALALASRYQKSGDTERAIWWLEKCIWLLKQSRGAKRPYLTKGGAVRMINALLAPKNHGLSSFLTLLAQLHHERGNQELAQRHANAALRILQSEILRQKDGWRSHLVAQEKALSTLTQEIRPFFQMRYASGTYYALRRVRELVGGNLFGNRRGYEETLVGYQHRIALLFHLHRISGGVEKLEQILENYAKDSPDLVRRRMYHLYLAGVYALRWEEERDPTLLKKQDTLLAQISLVQAPPQLHHALLTKRSWLLEQLEDDAKAVMVQQQLVTMGTTYQKKMALQRLAALYAKTGQKEKEHKTYLVLSSQYQDAYADEKLANEALEKKKITQAIRFYSLFFDRQKGRRYQYLRMRAPHLYDTKRQLELIEFLKDVLTPEQIHTRLQPILLLLQGHIKRGENDYLESMDGLLAWLQRIGKLDHQRKLWEERRKLMGSQDTFVLSALAQTYKMLSLEEKQREIAGVLLRLTPTEEGLLREWVSLHHAVKAEQREEALVFLGKIYHKTQTKPANYDLEMGRLLLSYQRPKEALAYLQNAGKNCSKQHLYSVRYQCYRNTGSTLLRANLQEPALALYRLWRNEQSNLYTQKSILLHAAQEMANQKRYKLLLRWLKEHQKATLLNQGRLDYNDFQIALLRTQALWAQKHPKLFDELASLAERPLTSVYSAPAAVGIFEKAEQPLLAEMMLWREMRATTYERMKQTLFSRLCHLWKKQGLGELCHPELFYKPSSSRVYLELAKKAESEGFSFLSMLMTRIAWLYRPRERGVLDLFLQRLERAGRAGQEGRQLQALRKRWFPRLSVPSFAKSKEEQRAVSSLWKQDILGFCQHLSIKEGRLHQEGCDSSRSELEKNQKIRCERKLVQRNGVLYTHDCMGHLIALEAKTGKALWVRRLVSERLVERVDSTPLSPLLSQVSQEQLLGVADLQVAGEDLFVAINESYFERGLHWMTGVNHLLHLVRLRASDGQVVWHQKRSAEAADRSLAITSERLIVSGRLLFALDRASGKEVWRQPQLGERGRWLLSSSSTIPLVSTETWLFLEQDHWLYALRCKDGHIAWKKRLSREATSLVVAENQLFLLLPDALQARDIAQGALLWSSPLYASSFPFARFYWLNFPMTEKRGNGLLVHGEQVIAATYGAIRRFDRKTGKPLWEQPTQGLPLHPPVLTKDNNVLLSVTHQGELVLRDLLSGELRSRIRAFAAPSSQGDILGAFSHTLPLTEQQAVYMGFYEQQGSFAIHALPTQPPTLLAPEQRLLAWVERLQKQKKQGDAQHLLRFAIQRNSTAHQPLRQALLQAQKRLATKSFPWIEGYLAHATDLKAALTFVLEKSAVDKKLPRLMIQTEHPFWQSENRVRLLLAFWKEREKNRSIHLHRWLWPMLYSYPSQMRSLDSPVSRRVMHLLRKEGVGEIRHLASVMLAAWGDPSVRGDILSLLHPQKKQPLRLNTKEARLLFLQLVSWSFKFRWKGLLLPSDIPQVLPILAHKDAHLRALAALFIAEVIGAYPSLRAYNTPQVRKILVHTGRLSGIRIDYQILAGRSLAALGEWEGIEILRYLYKRAPSHFRSDVASHLSEYEDDTGYEALFASVQGQNKDNLLLPSFRLIYAGRLLQVKRFDEAEAELRKVHQMPARLLSPTHRILAYLQQARLLLERKQGEAALSLLDKLQRIDPVAQSSLQEARGFAAFHAKKFEEAKKQWTAFLKENPYSERAPRVSDHLARLYLREGKESLAHALFQPLLAYYNNTPSLRAIHVAYAKAFFEGGSTPAHFQEALKQIQKALQMFKDLPSSLLLEAKILDKLGQRAAAIERIERAKRLDTSTSPRQKDYRQLLQQWSPKAL